MAAPVRRRSLLRAGLAVGALTATGCVGEATTAVADPAFPRTVVDAEGVAVLIPADPQRVVVATEYSALDALLALGRPPVAAVRHYGFDWPWSLAAGSEAVPRIVEQPDGPDVEAIASYEPDLVLLQYNLDPAFGQTLGRLAPTIRYNADDGRASLRTVADALGVPGEAGPLIAALDARVAAARDRIATARRAGWTFSTFEPQGPDTAGVWGLGVDATILLTDLGLRPSPLLAATTGYGSVAAELVPELDADLVLGRDIEFGGDETFTAFEANPLFRGLPAVTAGRYRRLSVQDSWAIGQSTILSWGAAIDVLESIVLGVPG